MLPLHRTLSSLSSDIFILFRPCLLHIISGTSTGSGTLQYFASGREVPDRCFFSRSRPFYIILPPSSHSIVSLFLYFHKSPYIACVYFIFPFPSPVQWCIRYFMLLTANIRVTLALRRVTHPLIIIIILNFYTILYLYTILYFWTILYTYILYHIYTRLLIWFCGNFQQSVA